MSEKMPMMVMGLIMLISIFFVAQGIGMHNEVDVKEAEFHALQEQYFLIDKATRDSAPAGSDLNKQLVELQQTPSELLRLKLVGVGKILTGIYALLFGILIALMMMPVRMAKLQKENM